jgi:hypothetical protein
MHRPCLSSISMAMPEERMMRAEVGSSKTPGAGSVTRSSLRVRVYVCACVYVDMCVYEKGRDVMWDE